MPNLQMQNNLFGAAYDREVKTQLPETSLIGEIFCFFGYEPVQPDVTPFPQRSLCMTFIYPRTEYNQQQIPYTTQPHSPAVSHVQQRRRHRPHAGR